MRQIHLPWTLIHQIVGKMPTTHELGGHLLPNRAMDTITNTTYFEGAACRGEDGGRISKDVPCKIKKPDAAFSFHTHPKSNRPSSADIKNSVSKHPLVGGGERMLSIVFTPTGIWQYHPSDAWWSAPGSGGGGVGKNIRSWRRVGPR